MKSSRKDVNELVRLYQEENNAMPLLNHFQYHFDKYYTLLGLGIFNVRSYEMRSFLSNYIHDKEKRSRLLGKYYTKEDVKDAKLILKYLMQAFKGYEKQEIYHELIIPFLVCAKRYQVKNSTFRSYLYKTYQYELMRHLNSILFQSFHAYTQGPIYTDFEMPFEEQETLDIFLEADLELNHPDWLTGKTATFPFNQFDREGRLILNKYYIEQYTDKEIGRLIGKNRRSVNRSRLRMVRKLQEMAQRREIKCIRLRT